MTNIQMYLAALQPQGLTNGTLYEISVPTLANSLTLPFTMQELTKILVRSTAEEAEAILTSELGLIINCTPAETDMEQVTQILERELTSNSHKSNLQVQGAIKRLHGLATLRHRNEWGPDIIFKAFDDIDIVFFGGWLRGRTRLNWYSGTEIALRHPNYSVHQKTLLGLADLQSQDMVFFKKDKDDKTITLGYVKYGFIKLNATLIFLEDGMKRNGMSSWDCMWETLLHEMVHVYLHCFTGQYAEPWLPSEKETCQEHGVHFHRCWSAVLRRGRELGLLSLGTEMEGGYAPLKVFYKYLNSKSGTCSSQ